MMKRNILLNHFNTIILSRFSLLYSRSFSSRFFSSWDIKKKDSRLNRIFFSDIRNKFNTSLTGGFKGYDQSYIFNLSHINNLDLIKTHLNNFLNTLSDNTLYSLLPVGSYIDQYGNNVYKSLFKESIKITKNTHISDICYNLHLSIDVNLDKYSLDNIDQIILYYKVWVVEADLNVSYNEAVKILDKVLNKRLIMNKIINPIGGSNVTSSKGYKDFSNLRNNSLTAPLFDYNLVDYDNINNSSKFYPGNFILNVNKLDNNIFNVIVTDFENKIVFKFKDQLIINNLNIIKLIRRYNDFELVFEDSKYSYGNIRIRMDSFKQIPRVLVPDYNIGTIDLETCISKNKSELLIVYATAFAVENWTETYFLGDNGLNNSESLILKMVQDIFNYKLYNNTFYCHNLSRFDSHFLLKTLLDAGYFVKPIIKDDKSIISLKISTLLPSEKGGKKKKVSFNIFDSILLLKGSLKNLGRDFDVNILKTTFPHKFVTLDNLSYIGPTPSKEYYNIDEDYNSVLVSKEWNLKEELLKYLKNDVESLREILFKFAHEIYELFDINITEFKTLPSLALNIYLSNFYDPDKNSIKIVKGDIEKNIRESYYGGITKVYKNEIKKGYYYDINSHYPNCMKKPLPIGDPIYTDNNNLDELFGFVKAKVIAPNESILKNPILPIRSDDGLILPRGTFYGWWFSEELKNARNNGYKINVIEAWVFNKSENLFDEYVNKLYDIKVSFDLNPSRRQTAKLLLNSLYGRMGMNEIESRVKIIPSEEVNNFTKHIYWHEIINMGKYTMIRYTSKIDPLLNKIIDKKSSLGDNTIINKRRGVPSSVPIASAITAYARIEISKYLNLPNNNVIYLDTDGVALECKLDSKYVGSEIGKMKLEYEIEHGIFISPKVYCIKYRDLSTNEAKFKYVAKGLGGNSLNYNDYKKLLIGSDIIKDKYYFHPAPELGGVLYYKQPFSIKGVKIDQ